MRGLRRVVASLSVLKMADVPPPFVPGAFVGAAHHYRARIYFEDTDLSGIVYHANYLRYMERARSDMLRLAGIDQRAAMEGGEGAWAVTDLTIKYRSPAKLDDDILVVSTVEAVRGASVIIAQRILRGQDELTNGRVTAAFLSPEGRPRRQPAGWAERFTAIMNGETFPC
ncbi:thioesterase [Sphingopyxis sp. H050]|nr:thioesterase [Sphingopyxis sp. H050]